MAPKTAKCSHLRFLIENTRQVYLYECLPCIYTSIDPNLGRFTDKVHGDATLSFNRIIVPDIR